MLGEDAATAWLTNTLEADSALSGMVNAVAPEAVWGTIASPFVRIDRLEQTDLMVVGLYRVWTDCLYHVRGCFHWRGQGQPDRTSVDEIGGRIDELLHKVEATDANGVGFHSFRVEGEPDPSLIDGTELWLQSGGLYRVRAQVPAAV